MPQVIEVPGVGEVEFPDDMTDEQIVSVIKANSKKQTPSLYQQTKRGVGLAARHALGGLADSADLLAAPVREFVTNPLLSAFGMQKGEPLGAAADRASNAIGLPTPETKGERIVGYASRTLAGAGGIGGLAKFGAKYASGLGGNILGALTANQTGQAGSAIGAGAAGGYAKEEGGDPIEQFAASILGGVAGGLAAPAMANAFSGAVNFARQVVSPRDVSGRIQIELERAGIDWNALSQEAKTALVKDAQKAIYSGQPLNRDALRRLSDYRNIGATPTVGAITQNPRAITKEKNLAKQLANISRPLDKTDLPTIENENAKRVIGALGGVADSPLDTYGTGNRIIQSVRNQDDIAREAEGWLYSAARDSSGRAAGINRGQFVNDAFDELAKSNKGAFLPKEIRTVLNNISRGQTTIGGKTHDVPFDVDTIDQLKTMLATASRSTKDGNVKSAIGVVRNALERVKPESSSADALKAFDKAREFARGRREWQESASFIEDALDGATPDDFVRKHIVSSSVEELGKLSRFVGKDRSVRDAIRKQLIEHISNRGRVDADTTKFSSAGMNDALKQIGDRKLAMFFNKSEIQQIKSAVNVARYMQSQPIGSAVNNSNTGAMVFGRLSDILMRGSQRLPVIGPMVADPIRGAALNFSARQAMQPSNALLTPVPRQPFPYNSLLFLAGTQGGQN